MEYLIYNVMEEKIRISVSAYGITHTAELHEGSSVEELVDVFSRMIEAMSFDSELVNDGLRKVLESRI